MMDQANLETLFKDHGFADFKWVKPKDFVVSQWVRMKCLYGCSEYGRSGSCPPNVPSVPECRRFFDEYGTAAVFHFEKTVDQPEDRHAWTRDVNRKLLKLEREVFLRGYHKTFLLFMDTCSFCSDCAPSREECRDPKSARPSPEAMAMDVFNTVRPYGYPIEVLSGYSQVMNRYAFLLIE